MGIGEDLKNFVTIIFLRTVSGVMIFGLSTKGCVEGGSRCLTYMGKDLTYVHLTRRQLPVESVFSGGIGEFCNHKDETCDNSD